MRLVTWNVNSLNARLPRVLELLALHEPDVLCLQETKCDPGAFPEAELARMGYAAAHHSAGRWAGVAVLAREEAVGAPRDVTAGLPGEARPEEARWMEATVGDVRVCSAYVVNGREVGSTHFAEKLRFLDAMADRAEALRRAGGPVVVAGDFNVAPDDADVYDTVAFAGSTHVTPDERDRVERVLQRGGLVDAYRAVHPLPEVGYTWWDYRQGHFHRKMGLRIDLVCVSEALAGGLTRCGIERDFRKGTKPSDHAPLVADWG